MGVRGDLQLLEMAVRRRFPIDAEKAARTVNQFLDDTDPRVALRAAAIAALMESQNQKDEHKIIDGMLSSGNDRLSSVAADLGLDPGLIEAAAREASSGDSGDAERDSEPAHESR